MCWPSLEGSIQIEERKPKYKNGPKRKRFFVKEYGPRDSDEWTLAGSHRPHSSRGSEMRDHALPRYTPHPHDPRWAPHPHMAPQMHHQIPPPPPHQHQPQVDFYDQQRLAHYPYHDPGDEIIRIEEPGRHNQHLQVQLPPRVVEVAPRQPIQPMPSHLRPRERSRGRGHSRNGSGTESLFSGSSYSSSHHGGRGRRSVYSDDDSFRDEPRMTVRRVSTRRNR